MLLNDNEYLKIVEQIKQEIANAQYKAIVNVNKELIMLYYNIGKTINAQKSWGNRLIDNLARDIKLAYPNITGFSVRNLKYMAKFAEIYADVEIVQQVVAQIPWGQNIVLIDKIENDKIRIWYARETLKNGWSRNVLTHQIETKLYERQVVVEKITNFEEKLPKSQSELAVQTIKDPYIFDFIPFKEDMIEKDI